MPTANIKQQAHQLLDSLPDSATWEDVMYRIYVRQAIDAGVKDSDAGQGQGQQNRNHMNERDRHAIINR